MHCDIHCPSLRYISLVTNMQKFFGFLGVCFTPPLMGFIPKPIKDWALKLSFGNGLRAELGIAILTILYLAWCTGFLRQGRRIDSSDLHIREGPMKIIIIMHYINCSIGSEWRHCHTTSQLTSGACDHRHGSRCKSRFAHATGKNHITAFDIMIL